MLMHSTQPRSRRHAGRRYITPLSPIGLALISYMFFVICTLIPPGVYESIMREPNRIFLDPASYLLVTASVLSFILGAWLLRSSIRRTSPTFISLPLGRGALLVPLLTAVMLNLMSVSIFLKNNPTLMTAWLIDAAAAKNDLDTTGGLAEALPLLFGVCWWALWRLLEREAWLGKADWPLRAVLWISFIFALVTALMKVARYDLMPGLLGFILVYIVFRYRYTGIQLRRYVSLLMQAGLVLLSLFLLMSWLRGNSTQSDMVNNVMGYTVASYNRLAAVLSGEIQYPYSGSGTYTLRFLDHIPLLHRWIDTGAMFNMPDSVDVWISEFQSVYQAGLDGSYIWASAFGYVYADIGLFALIYFFILGVLAGWLWRSILNSRSIGVVVYPWFAFSILFWFGSNFVAYPRLVTFTAAGVLLHAYEWLARIKKGRAVAYTRAWRTSDA